MKIARFRQSALSALAVLLISGAGIAYAGNSPSTAPSAGVRVAGSGVTTEPAEPAGADTDTLQEGDQTTPDTAAEKAAESEKAGAEEPGDANLPGGGYADDPNDANADHQFEGVE